jgi:hypothetical protein
MSPDARPGAQVHHDSIVGRGELWHNPAERSRRDRNVGPLDLTN